MTPTDLRKARARLQLVALELRAPSSTANLCRALELIGAAARRLELEADRVNRCGTVVEYDDGRAVART